MAAHFKPGCDANALPHAADGGLLRPVHDGRTRRLQCVAHGCRHAVTPNGHQWQSQAQ